MILYQPVIGLEIHCQLATQSKLFCGCTNEFGAEPNNNTCPVCTGMPGSLPVLNELAVKMAIRLGLAMGCSVSLTSLFSRKNYFYPDLPKGYQITQYEHPICKNGRMPIEVNGKGREIEVQRIHLEEDAGKNLHGGLDGKGRHSFVDLNRAGSPLVEIVSAPDMHSPEEAIAYMKAVHSLVTHLGVSDGNLEKGNFRCDANVSVRPKGQKALGTRAEVKNINSFRYLGRAIEFELDRQIDLLEAGAKVLQETRGFDAATGSTFSQRSKEEANDYRYFPEPDLGPLVLESSWIRDAAQALPELPWHKKSRFQSEYGLSPYDAGVLTAEGSISDYFEAVVRSCSDAKTACNWVSSDILGAVKKMNVSIEDLGVSPQQLGALLRLVEDGSISIRIAKKVLEKALETGQDPVEIVKKQGLRQVSDLGTLEAILDNLIAANPEAFSSLCSGKDRLMGFFVGLAMKKTQGKANPKVLNEIMKGRIECFNTP